jgi:hypothetical protein
MATGEIREKLDAFIRKYYANQLLRGLMLSATLLLGLFLFINLSEYFGHFSMTVRALLFYCFWLTFAAVCWIWIVIPLRGLYKLGKVIGYHKAAEIIGNHFSTVQDKLLNLLQLEEMSVGHPDSALLQAGIEQKTKELRPVPFATAINFGENKKYLRYLAIPILSFAVILIFQSSIITDSTERLFNYSKHYAVNAPFDFVLKNKSLEIASGEDLELLMEIHGKSAPEEVFVNFDGQEIKMQSTPEGLFKYTFKNLKKSAQFYFEAAGFSSISYSLAVTPLPIFTGSEARVTYPAYTGKVAEKLSGTSDFIVPEGSEIEWIFDTRDAASLEFADVAKKGSIPSANSRGRYQLKRQFLKDENLKLVLKNPKSRKQDTASLSVKVIADQAPSIFSEKREDSNDIHQFYFLGNASDDYAVIKVTFNYRYVKSETEGKMKMGRISIPLRTDEKGSDIPFYYILNMDAIGMAPSDEVEYYFEAWDNDGIHGSKSSRTPVSTLRRQSIEEARKEADITQSKVKNLMQEAAKSATQLQKQNQKLQDQMNRQKSMDWNQESKVQELLEKQQQMQEKMQEILKEKEKLKQQKEEFQKNDEFKQRQDQLDELFKQMEDPEIKKLMEEIQKLLEKKAPKDQLNEKLNELEQKNENQAKDLEKLMEQYKQLQMEQKLTDNIDRLEKLAEKQEKLAKETEKAGKEKSAELQEKQEKLNQEMKDIQQEMKEMEQMNQDLKDPMNLDMGKEQSQGAQEQMGEAEKNLGNNKNKKASENQNDAAEKMKEAAQKMKESLESEKEKRTAEDYQTIRALLEKLVEASFDQEEIFTELATLKDYNPRYVELNRKQMAVKEECALIEDSLRVLAMRQPMIGTFITREMGRINSNMGYALDKLKERKLGEAAVKEQFVMTGLNNIAVMLLESMEDMQQQMAQKKKSKGNKACNNPNSSGQGQKSQGQKLTPGQQQLGESLQQLQKKAQQQREGQSGSGGKENQREMNKEFAKAALMQEALRRQLEQMRKELDKEGPEGKAMSKELQKTEEMMEQQERDLVNKKITPEMLRRQKEIETRMLEHEKAERNQEQEEKRESQTPGNYSPELPPELKSYMKEKQHERELLRQSPPELSPYYQIKSGEYLRTVR